MRKGVKKCIGILLGLLFIVGCFLGTRIIRVLWYPTSELRTEASQELENNYYSCFKLSMLPTEHFSHGEFEYFTAMATQEVDYCFYNLKDVQDYLEEIYTTQEEVKEIYLYLDPVEISAGYGNIARFYGDAYVQHLVSVMSAHPETFFGCIIPNYSVDYWSALDEKEQQEAEKCITDFLNQTELCENVKVYYLGFEEWLIANSANYVDERMHNEEVHSFMIARMIWREEYVLTRKNIEERLSLAQQIAAKMEKLPKTDLTSYDMVFFGDSVIGNYTDSMSIPGVVSGVSGARVYNCGFGGSTASQNDDSLHFGSMVEYFLSGNVEGLEESTFKTGVQNYWDNNHKQRKQCFIINYGLNDYFRGFPLENPADEEDSYSYGGAMRKGVRQIKEAFPDAAIIIMGPNLITAYENGTYIVGENGGALAEYVEEAQQIAAEYGALYIDNFHQAGYTLENAKEYLADDCHPNQSGRYLFARKIVETMEMWLQGDLGKKG